MKLKNIAVLSATLIIIPAFVLAQDPPPLMPSTPHHPDATVYEYDNSGNVISITMPAPHISGGFWEMSEMGGIPRVDGISQVIQYHSETQGNVNRFETRLNELIGDGTLNADQARYGRGLLEIIRNYLSMSYSSALQAMQARANQNYTSMMMHLDNAQESLSESYGSINLLADLIGL